MARKICVVTGSRADFGLLYWPMRLIADDPDLRLQTVVTGSHLSPAFGNTWREVHAAGFPIDAKVEMLLPGDSGSTITKSVGLALLGLADVFERLQPDLVMVLGDRYEMLAVVAAALFARIPVAHIAGGDTTEGAFDEQIRHALTKMSHLHFVTNAEAGARVRQMGENPSQIFDVGSPGLDRIRRMKYWPRAGVFRTIGLRPRKKNLAVSFHPATLDPQSSVHQLQALLDALDELGPDFGFVISGSNADPEGLGMGTMLERYAASRDNAVFARSFDHVLYLNILGQVDAALGNSSSGLYEVPSFGIPTVNVGDRQRGRLRAPSVIDCGADTAEIVGAVHAALAMDVEDVENPYGDGHTAPRILECLKAIDLDELVRKRFFGMEALHVLAA